MTPIKTIAAWMSERQLGLAELVAAAGVERRVVEAIVEGRYTPSPLQRERIAAALGVSVGEIAWGHVNPVESLYGHGPQFGRSP